MKLNLTATALLTLLSALTLSANSITPTSPTGNSPYSGLDGGSIVYLTSADGGDIPGEYYVVGAQVQETFNFAGYTAQPQSDVLITPTTVEGYFIDQQPVYQPAGVPAIVQAICNPPGGPGLTGPSGPEAPEPLSGAMFGGGLILIWRLRHRQTVRV